MLAIFGGDRSIFSYFAALCFFLLSPGNLKAQDDLQRGRHYYAIQNLATGEVILRGRAGSLGISHPPNSLILGPQTAYRHWVLQASTLLIGFTDFETPASGRNFQLADLFLGNSDAPDSDEDGLHDEGELVMGTDIDNPDSDGDGMFDGLEVIRGGNPLDGVATQTGIVGSLSVGGLALDAEAENDMVFLLSSTSGLTVLNVFNGMEPRRIGRVNLPGSAHASATTGNYLAVANGSDGLAIVDLDPLSELGVDHQVALPGRTWTVVAFCDQALAGSSTGTLSRVDLDTGSVLEDMSGLEAIQDLVLFGDHLYMLTRSDLIIFDLTLSGFSEVSRLPVTGSTSPLEVGRKLFVAGSHAYVGYFLGYKVIDISDPSSPTLVGEPATPQDAVHHIASAGNGRILATTSFAGADTLVLSQYDGTDPSDVTRLINSFPTPGRSRGFVIYNGLAYVADTDRGLQVVNYQSADTAGLPPSVSLASNSVSAEIVEGSLLRITAMALDDVHVRNVTFYLNDEPLYTDGNFPFEHRFKVPYFSADNQIIIQARASDTGGNTSWSGELLFEVVPDTSSVPQILDVQPENLSTHQMLDQVKAIFDKSMDPDTVTLASWEITEAGPDTILGTGDDVLVVVDEVGTESDPFAITARKVGGFTAGNYRVTVTTATKDHDGNGLASPVSWEFVVLSPQVTDFAPADGSTHESLSEISVTFSKDMDPTSFTTANWVLERPGSDGVFDTADDETQSQGIIVYESDGFRAYRRFPAGLLSGMYRVRATTNLVDAGGSPLPTETAWQFTVTAPEVLDTFPADNAMLDTLSQIRATFNRPMDPATINDQSFLVVEAGPDGVFDSADDINIQGANITLDQNGLIARASFFEGLPSGLFRAQLTTAMTDTNGQPLADAVSWSFTLLAPRLVSHFPFDGDNTELLDVVRLTFDKPIDPATITLSTFEIREAGVDGVFDTGDDVVLNAGAPTYANRIARRDFPNGLPSGSYRVSVSNTITDTLGHPLLSGDVFSFDNLGGTTISGLVHFSGGSPAAGVTVETMGTSFNKRATTTTAADGSFSIPKISTTLFQIIRVSAVLDQAGTTYRGAAEISNFVIDGVTDAGTILIAPFCDSEFEDGVFQFNQSVNGPVYALAGFDDGGGLALYAGGRFNQADGQAANHIVKWNESGFSSLSSDLNDDVVALTTFDDGTGSALYAGGSFSQAGGQPASRIAKWDGLAWQALGDGLNNRVEAMIVFDDGQGEALYVGGRFTIAGSAPANYIARWKNGSWEALGSGTGGPVLALTVFDDGNGPRLYAGGQFFSAGGVTVRNLARWEGGNTWVALQDGLQGTVRALTVHDDGAGADLYVGGEFAITGAGQSAQAIARWDGTQWSSLGNGLAGSGGGGHKRHGKTPFGSPGMVGALSSYDDGTGPALFVTGTFGFAGSRMSTNIAKWQVDAWWPIENGITSPFDSLNEPIVGLALLPLALGKSTSLYLGGSFTSVDFNDSPFLARIICAESSK